MISDVSGLTYCSWAFGEASQRKVAQFMAASKQRERKGRARGDTYPKRHTPGVLLP